LFNNIDIAAIRVLSGRAGVPLEWSLGISEVESAGRAFWNVDGKNLPAIRIEGHYFYRLLSGSKRATAVKLGLASPKVGGVKNPASYEARYAMLDQMRKIDNDAALMSISMGFGQVMGEHATKLGYPDVDDMWAEARSSLAGQAALMLGYITKVSPGCLKAILRGDADKVAELYNGKGWKKNDYGNKIRKAVAKWKRALAADDTQYVAAYDNSKELADIKALGFDSVEAFQRAYGLAADGIIGAITREAIGKAKAAKHTTAMSSATQVGGAVAGTATVVAVGAEASDSITKTLEQIAPITSMVSQIGTYGSVVVAVTVGALVVGMLTYVIVRRLRRGQHPV
jgi:hypothetical protein